MGAGISFFDFFVHASFAFGKTAPHGRAKGSGSNKQVLSYLFSSVLFSCEFWLRGVYQTHMYIKLSPSRHPCEGRDPRGSLKIFDHKGPALEDYHV